MTRKPKRAKKVFKAWAIKDSNDGYIFTSTISRERILAQEIAAWNGNFPGGKYRLVCLDIIEVSAKAKGKSK